MEEQKLFIWDLDDTLMWNAYTYSEAQQDFYAFLKKIWKKRIPSLGSVCTFNEEIDASLGAKINPETGEPYGFSKERFPVSLVETYRHLCEMGFDEFNEVTARRIYRIGLSAFNPKFYKDLVPGAEETLDYVREMNDVSVLLTKGDIGVQNKKIRTLGLRKKWFARRVHIAPNKTPHLFASLKKKYDIEPAFSVGNSYISDIQPAIDVGYTGIYIPCYTWIVEKTLVDSITKAREAKTITVEAIIDIKRIYKSGELDQFVEARKRRKK